MKLPKEVIQENIDNISNEPFSVDNVRRFRLNTISDLHNLTTSNLELLEQTIETSSDPESIRERVSSTRRDLEMLPMDQILKYIGERSKVSFGIRIRFKGKTMRDLFKSYDPIGISMNVWMKQENARNL
jgi:hypothetical protein